MPRIFTDIDLKMKDFFFGKQLSEISAALPEGEVYLAGKWVQSQPITLPGHSLQCYIRGIFDTVIRLSDGSYGVIDFKTSEVKEKNVAFYSRQLRAYAYSLEHPAAGKLGLSPITKLGLLVFEPSEFLQKGDQLQYIGRMAWQECPMDEGAFLAFLDKVYTVLERPEAPEANEDCQFCSYRDKARNTGL